LYWVRVESPGGFCVGGIYADSETEAAKEVITDYLDLADAERADCAAKGGAIHTAKGGLKMFDPESKDLAIDALALFAFIMALFTVVRLIAIFL
jgi:hypothetical protein